MWAYSSELDAHTLSLYTYLHVLVFITFGRRGCLECSPSFAGKLVTKLYKSTRVWWYYILWMYMYIHVIITILLSFFIDAIPLIFHKNGVVMFQGPFRPFSDPTTRQCVQDLMDGYYPSELQSTWMECPSSWLIVEMSLSSQKSMRTFSRRVDANWEERKVRRSCSHLELTWDRMEEEHQQRRHQYCLVLYKVSVENFLSRLPASVVKGGRVLDVRAGVAEVLHVSNYVTK